jgi:hypothetical protein
MISINYQIQRYMLYKPKSILFADLKDSSVSLWRPVKTLQNE